MPPKPASDGVVLPANAKGERSSTSFGRDVMAKAAGETDLGAAIAREKDWRHGYIEPFVRLTEVGAESKESVCEIADRGLKHAIGAAEFIRDGAAVSLSALPPASPARSFGCAKISQSGSEVAPTKVPYRGEQLEGQQLVEQIDAWVQKGCMEESAAQAAKAGLGKSGQGLRDHQFVVLGAGSELGPFELLLKAGATVLAVATRRPGRWKRHMAYARFTAGTMLVPLAPGASETGSDEELAEAAGADLSADLPEVLDWLAKNLDPKRPTTVGTYIYADGEANVRLTLAADVVIQKVLSLGCSAITLAWIGSPSTANVLPAGCAEDSASRRESAPWWQKLAGYFPNNDRPPVPGTGLQVNNGYSMLQGPNYALAQQLRVWRAAIALSAGVNVSFNYAPACRTESVLKSSAIKTALAGFPHFAPMEVFDGDAVKAVMFLILVSDVLGLRAKPAECTNHPLAYISDQSFHGGYWRTAFNIDSCGKSCYVLGTLRPVL